MNPCWNIETPIELLIADQRYSENWKITKTAVYFKVTSAN